MIRTGPLRTSSGRSAPCLSMPLRSRPATIQVIIQEVARSDRFVQREKVDAFNAAFSVIRSIVEVGQARGELRKTIDPEVAAYAFFGALETICTGLLLNAAPLRDHRHAERVKETVNQMMLSGLCVPPGGSHER